VSAFHAASVQLWRLSQIGSLSYHDQHLEKNTHLNPTVNEIIETLIAIIKRTISSSKLDECQHRLMRQHQTANLRT